MVYKNKRSKQKLYQRKGALFALAALVVLLGGAGLYYYRTHQHPTKPVASPQDPPIQEKVNYAPPSPSESGVGDSIKQDIVKQQDQQPPTTSNGKKTVTPVITSARVSSGTVAVRGFMTGAIETTGTCEFVFTKGSQTYSKQTTVTANATTTDCVPLSFPGSELPSGSTGWKVTLRYSSPTSEGTSAAQDLTVE